MTDLVADAPATVPAPRRDLRRTGRLRSLIAATRPRQWVKNGLVLAAPLAAGTLLRPPVMAGAALACAAFICASAAVYLVNDIIDRERDRQHPRKAHRPIAAGLVTPSLALTAAAALAGLAVGAPLALGNPPLTTVIAIYLTSCAGYTLRGKHIAGLELLLVASGFVLRAWGGAVGARVEPSAWFLTVSAVGALTITFGKRYAELVSGADESRHTRPVLAAYRSPQLAAGRDLSAGATVVCYLGWVATRSTEPGSTVAALSVVPLLAAMARYRALNEMGLGEAPEELLLTDRPLQALIVGWATAVAVAIALV